MGKRTNEETASKNTSEKTGDGIWDYRENEKREIAGRKKTFGDIKTSWILETARRGTFLYSSLPSFHRLGGWVYIDTETGETTLATIDTYYTFEAIEDIYNTIKEMRDRVLPKLEEFRRHQKELEDNRQKLLDSMNIVKRGE